MAERRGTVPVYLPDRTVIGKAWIADDGQHIQIELDRSTAIPELMEENLLGLSIVYQRAEANDIIREFEAAKEKETDE